MIILKAAAAAASLFVALFVGRSDPPPGHCTNCLVAAAAFGFLAALILWGPTREK